MIAEVDALRHEQPPCFAPTSPSPVRLRRRAFGCNVAAAVLLAVGAFPAAAAAQLPFAPEQVVVGLRPVAARAAAYGEGVRERVIHLRRGESVWTAIERLRRERRVAWAVPNYTARISARPLPLSPAGVAQATEAAKAAFATALDPAPFIPINEGLAHRPGGWQLLQWNFVGPFGVEAPLTWSQLIADGRPGGKGVVVAVLDTGIAFRNWHRFRRSPGFLPDQFVPGKDFVDPATPPLDRNGHGTFVAGEIAEATNIRYGLTGLAYGVKLMPVRVLDAAGEGNAETIAKGIRFAVNHHAQVINMSLEFPAVITASEVPELISALRYAARHGVLVVAAAGNDDSPLIPYPARFGRVVAVGATTEHGCLADYSNFGRRVTIVAPGGGPDADIPNDPDCHPFGPPGRDIFQVTLIDHSINRFGIPNGYEGTSMAAAEVSAAAALVIASGVVGHHPSPQRVVSRLVDTARKIATGHIATFFGAGLLDAAAATAPPTATKALR